MKKINNFAEWKLFETECLFLSKVAIQNCIFTERFFNSISRNNLSSVLGHEPCTTKEEMLVHLSKLNAINKSMENKTKEAQISKDLAIEFMFKNEDLTPNQTDSLLEYMSDLGYLSEKGLELKNTFWKIFWRDNKFKHEEDEE